jgi:hypothetical protein
MEEDKTVNFVNMLPTASLASSDGTPFTIITAFISRRIKQQ